MQLARLVEHLDSWYDPSWAEPWDRVGLVCGDPQQDVGRVLFAVDPVAAVVDEALEHGADLVVVHHPLLLTPVSSIAATTPKGRLLHRLISGGVALFTAHTNADVPADGTNDAIARALGLREVEVLAATDDPGLDKLVVFVPADAAARVRDAITAAGAGAIGAYDSCTFTAPGEGRFRPLQGADPVIGSVGGLEVVDEVRIEAVVPRALRRRLVEAVRASHPYEEPAFDLTELLDTGPPVTGPRSMSTRGHGRVGTLAEPVTLTEFAARVAAVLPATAHGVRVAGYPEQQVQRVAVGAGSGDALLEDVRRSGVDAFVTSDLKHHRVSEFFEDSQFSGSPGGRSPGGPAVLDVAHWAAESLWLPVVAEKVRRAAAAAGATVDTRVSRVVTDPWSSRA